MRNHGAVFISPGVLDFIRHAARRRQYYNAGIGIDKIIWLWWGADDYRRYEHYRCSTAAYRCYSKIKSFHSPAIITSARNNASTLSCRRGEILPVALYVTPPMSDLPLYVSWRGARRRYGNEHFILARKYLRAKTWRVFLLAKALIVVAGSVSRHRVSSGMTVYNNGI